jgi:hypothetical protein
MEVNMRKLWLLTTVLGLWLSIAGPVSAATQPGFIGVYSLAACKDTTTVAVSGTSIYATNRVKVSVYVQNSDGDYVFRRSVTSDNFSSGDFLIPLTVDYSDKKVAEGTALRVDVKLQRQSGGSFTTISGPISTYVSAADRSCKDKCSVTITTLDRAPANGTITLRTHFGDWFRPEGRLYGAIPVSAGQRLHNTVVGVPCNATARVWYYPATGKDRTPRLLPSQYWPVDYGVSEQDGAIPYAASFARGVPATKPLEADDPYAPK